MAVKGGMQYKTKNRDALIAYLQTREGEHVTVNEISPPVFCSDLLRRCGGGFCYFCQK